MDLRAGCMQSEGRAVQRGRGGQIGVERWLSPVADLVDNYLLRIPEQLAGVGYWNEAANHLVKRR